MKIKPLLTDKIQTVHTGFVVNFQLESNITFIEGDSGTGKSAVFSFIEELSTSDKRIRCFNYLDYGKLYKNSIRQLKGKIIVIDNADLLLDGNMRKHIAFDELNQYIIIGRNPEGLLLTTDELFHLVSYKSDEKVIFELSKEVL